MSYTTRQVATLYGVVNETIRNWTIEFAGFLSPTAKPGKNKNRFYTVADLEVFSLVADLKKLSMTNDEIRAALQNGQRGTPPPLDPNQLQVIASGEKEHQLSIEIAHLRHTLVKMQEELELARAEAGQAQQVKEANIRLTTRLEELQTVAATKDQELQAIRVRLEAKIEELSRAVGEAYAKGYIAALERRQTPRQDE